MFQLGAIRCLSSVAQPTFHQLSLSAIITFGHIRDPRTLFQEMKLLFNLMLELCIYVITHHGGDRNICTRQEILTPCQVEQLSQKSSNKLVFAIKVVHISILFIL